MPQGGEGEVPSEDRPEAAGGEEEVRDIHALITPAPAARRRESWEAGSQSSSTLSEIMSENFNTMSREFNALVLAGSSMQQAHTAAAPPLASFEAGGGDHQIQQLARIGEDADAVPIRPSNTPDRRIVTSTSTATAAEAAALHRVKKKEVESKIAAWQTAEFAKANNRFKRQEVIINNWERQQAEKAAIWLKNIERKLEEKKARAAEKMRNEVAEARRKAEEKRASAEAKRGTKLAGVFQRSNLMRALRRAPTKFSFRLSC